MTDEIFEILQNGDPTHPVMAKWRWRTFMEIVLTLFEGEANDDLLWAVGGDGELRFSAQCSDRFVWGSADCEPITPDTLGDLTKAYSDAMAVGDPDHFPLLYAARLRKMRP